MLGCGSAGKFYFLSLVAADCIALNYLGKHKQEMAIRGIN